MRFDRIVMFASARATPALAVLVVAAALLTPSPAGSESRITTYQVVVHMDNPVETLSRTEVSKIFLKRQVKWRDGFRATPVDQPRASPLREAFSLDIHKRSAAKIRSFWQQQIYSGRGVPPTERSSDAEVVSFVATDRTAIGYVSSSADVRSVAVVAITQ